MAEPAASGQSSNGNRAPARRHGEVLREFLPIAGQRIADIGCGDGAILRLVAREGPAEAIGVEPSEEQLARARAHDAVAHEHYVEGRGESLPFSDEAVDVILYFNALHHVPVDRQAGALEEAARVLVPGGILFVVEPLAEGPWFELVRCVDDETEVRAAAYSRLREALGQPRWDEAVEYYYDAPIRLDGFEAVKERVLAADPGRRKAFEAVEAELRARFHETATALEDGRFEFLQPHRLNILRRREVS
ncbi:MAG: class I SAM-dependent methyltransferase [Rhodovibrionaceae bacterium]|nr:class I SAM-dependent methyltransferase [Rhodovibrionaceae bacterium]